MIYRDKKRNLLAKWISLLPIKNLGAKTFQGIVNIEEWNGKAIRAFAVNEDGIVLPVHLENFKNYKQISYNGQISCFTYTYWGRNFYTGGQSNFYVIRTESYCSGSGSGEGQEGQDNENRPTQNDEEEAGDYTNYYMDCNNDIDGTAVINPDCNTCMGGNTGITECLVDTVMNPKFYKNAKAKCALDKLMEDNFYKNILNNFIGANKPIDLTFKLDPIPAQSGYIRYGTTIPNPTNWNSKNIDLTLNEELIDSLPSIEVAFTLIHEGIHAEIYRKLLVIHGPNNLNIQNFPSMFNLYQQYKLSEGFSHEYIANYYVDIMAGALRKYDNNKLDLAYYKALAWGGLEGTSSYVALTKEEKDNITSKTSTLLLNRNKNNCNDR